MSEKHTDTNQSLSRGLLLIEFLSDYPDGCPLALISERTGLNKSTAHRLLKSLQNFEYVTPTATPGSYRLTSKLSVIGYRTYSSFNIVKLADPHLESLNRNLGHMVNFSTRAGNNYILIYKLESTTGILCTRFYVGQRLLLYCSAMGKAYLAHSSDGALVKYWDEERESIVQRTPHTITDIDALRHELAAIRAEGVSYDREENELGVICIAAPVFDIQGKVNYALSVSMPAAKAGKEERNRTAAAVRETADGISREIGGADHAAVKGEE